MLAGTCLSFSCRTPVFFGTGAGTTFLKRFRAPNLQPFKCFVEKILDARERRQLISLSSVADGGEGRGEEALLKNLLSLTLSPRSAGGAREWLPSRTDNLFYKARPAPNSDKSRASVNFSRNKPATDAS